LLLLLVLLLRQAMLISHDRILHLSLLLLLLLWI
jgi:hypothetical protein